MALGSGQRMRVHAAAHPPGALSLRSIGRLPPQCSASCSTKPYFGLNASHAHVKVLAAGECKQSAPRCWPHVDSMQSCACPAK